MCLHVRSEEKVAEEDIPCIKILFKNMVSIFYKYYYTINKKEVNDLFETAVSIYDREKIVVYNGYHSYCIDIVDLDDDALRDIAGDSCFMFVVVKCIIPKGSLYYEGVHSDKMQGYASNAIIPVEIIKTI